MIAIFKSVAEQLMDNAGVVKVDGQRFPVRPTSTQHLKIVTFLVDGHEYAAIEQNPDKRSRWGQLARDGHKVVQFKDIASNRFTAVAVDGEVREYGGRRK